MKKTIIFDFGGVLINWDPRNLYRKLFEDEAEMEWFLANVCTMDWNLKQDEGRPFAEAVAFLQDEHKNYATYIEAYHTRWPEMLDGEIAGSVGILKELQEKGYTVYGLTNWSQETFPIAFEQFAFLQTLHGIVVSGVEKLIKPNPAIFNLLLNRYNLKAEDCVFIDDNAHNIETANKLGLHAIRFTNPDNLRQELQKIDIL
jgi:2-haloacid dehalogenase